MAEEAGSTAQEPASAGPAQAAPAHRPPLPATGTFRAMPIKGILAEVAILYQAKALADSKNDKAHKPREPIQQFLKAHLIRKFGLRSLAEQHLVAIGAGIRREQASSVRLRVFGRVSGMLDPDEHHEGLCDVVLEGLKAVYAESSIQARLMEDAQLSLADITAATLSVVRSRHYFADHDDLQEPLIPGGEPTLAPNVIAQLITLSSGVSCGEAETAAAIGWVGVDLWLEWLLKSYADSKSNAATLFAALYDRFDTNRDGVLDLDEFSALVWAMDKTVDESDVLAMFQQALDLTSQGDRIAKEAFVRVAMDNHLPCNSITAAAAGIEEHMLPAALSTPLHNSLGLSGSGIWTVDEGSIQSYPTPSAAVLQTSTQGTNRHLRSSSQAVMLSRGTSFRSGQPIGGGSKGQGALEADFGSAASLTSISGGPKGQGLNSRNSVTKM